MNIAILIIVLIVVLAIIALILVFVFKKSDGTDQREIDKSIAVGRENALDVTVKLGHYAPLFNGVTMEQLSNEGDQCKRTVAAKCRQRYSGLALTRCKRTCEGALGCT